jgi:hypothetical protein
MTDNNHPIAPPPELMQQWWEGTHGALYEFEAVVTQAARWGADMELEACCDWLRSSLPGYDKHYADYLHTGRRPKPPSLKEQALKTLQKLSVSDYPCNYQGDEDWDTIRCAIESLPD